MIWSLRGHSRQRIEWTLTLLSTQPVNLNNLTEISDPGNLPGWLSMQSRGKFEINDVDDDIPIGPRTTPSRRDVLKGSRYVGDPIAYKFESHIQ